MEIEQKDSNEKFKLAVIAILLILIIAVAIVGFLLIKNEKIVLFNKNENNPEEYTKLLEEFIVNLKPESTNKRNGYLKLQIALMYTEPKKEEFINKNINKIRDRITYQLRCKTASEMRDVENERELKNSIKDDINEALNEDIIKDIYFTDIVVQ